MSLLSIAALALKVGPAAIRGISSLFGGSDTADKVAEAVEQVDAVLGMNKEQKELAVTRKLQALPPESMVELERIKLEMEKELTRRMELDLNDKQAEHHETQATIRAGDVAEDEYVRHTRPWGSRLSLYSAIAYIFLFELLEAFSKGTGADWEIATGLMAPFLTYLGWRSADKRSLTKGTGTMMGDLAAVVKRK
ncbi:hypothetical protein [Vibrio parahaemolyticus]|uniref:hypothetical protein n=1 Tax=Vibrio parahaemolyticus TaxID=670 RepID=UPI000C86BD72|nr:hypothetical protein [Vibrio parahaemolyticus]PMS49923.1 hypothetical protein C1S89_08995 [Vibrio parahaemolyticus]PMS54994.1 hypothetical protein C1T11_00170 [Vibrio parahaemolyticus]PMS60323.1 hypothetical protein C1T09_00220 [Vibrio parahaemolyticus]PMS90411.1 hypothetical protein C1S90_00220 [Vibrio parahaemolyticus]PMT04268.1 hypothetical protein C1S98_00220 [Vibrio parahaemolyticus]